MFKTILWLVGVFNGNGSCNESIVKIPVNRNDIKSAYKSHFNVVMYVTVFKALA